MARYDYSKPYTQDYDDDCAYCGEEFPRGELAWIDDELCCAACETKFYPEPQPTHLLK